MLYRHRVVRNLSRCQQPHPVLLPKGPPEGHQPIMLHKSVPPQHPRHAPKHSATPLRPLQIIDEPTYLRSPFHPPQQCDDLLILQMMCRQRTHDDIHRLLRPIHQSIAGHPRDSELFRRGLRGRSCRIRIQIDPCQLYGDAAPSGPSCNLPQQAAAAASYIKDLHRITQPTR